MKFTANSKSQATKASITPSTIRIALFLLLLSAFALLHVFLDNNPRSSKDQRYQFNAQKFQEYFQNKQHINSKKLEDMNLQEYKVEIHRKKVNEMLFQAAVAQEITRYSEQLGATLHDYVYVVDEFIDFSVLDSL